MKNKLPLFLVFLLCTFQIQAQYTEVINSNRPGESQGAFAVGRGVLQIEGGGHYGKAAHNLTDLETTSSGVNYEFRYGLLWEQLEINLSGDFLFARQEEISGGQRSSYSVNDFKTNTLGLKYLLYDPYKKRAQEGPNLYSWKANHQLHWNALIPAVSIYAGANLTFGDRPYKYPFFGNKRNNISPKVALITQHNIRSFVFVMNFIADRLSDDHPRYAMIFTLTHAFTHGISAFAEFKTIRDNYYSDELFRLGGAYLVTPDLQLDLSGLINFKDTPSRWEVGLGVSYRFDFHTKNEILKESNP